MVRIEPPGTLDGGDVLAVGGHFLVGLSARTNAAGAAQLGRIVERHGHTWCPVPVHTGLHLKSNVNEVFPGTLLVAPELAARVELRRYERIVVDEAERYACNALRLDDHLLVASGYPRTLERLAASAPPGTTLHELDMSEVRKMDGGLTCLSLRFSRQRARSAPDAGPGS